MDHRAASLPNDPRGGSFLPVQRDQNSRPSSPKPLLQRPACAEFSPTDPSPPLRDRQNLPPSRENAAEGSSTAVQSPNFAPKRKGVNVRKVNEMVEVGGGAVGACVELAFSFRLEHFNRFKVMLQSKKALQKRKAKLSKVRSVFFWSEEARNAKLILANTNADIYEANDSEKPDVSVQYVKDLFHE